MTVAMKDGKLYCEFTRPKAMSVVNMFNDTEMITFDINKEYYVMIAWGFTHRGIYVLDTLDKTQLSNYRKI